MALHGLPTLRIGHKKEIAILVEAWRSGLRGGSVLVLTDELCIETHTLLRKTNVAFIGELLADSSHGAATGARGHGVAFQDGDVCCTTPRHLVGSPDCD